MNHPPPPARIAGIDFSGASDAGRRVWIAEGRRDGAALRLERCRPAAALPGAAPDRAAVYAALIELIGGLGDSVIGIDVPFGITQRLFPETVSDWRVFLAAFARHWPQPERFRAACRAGSPAGELRRDTDDEAATPFAPHNLRIYRMTWHGIAGLIAPLVLTGRARAAPMQERAPRWPLLMEACPASFLKRTCPALYRPYKGRSPAQRAARRAILRHLVHAGLLMPPAHGLKARILDNAGGDALDAVLAAVIALKESADPANLRPRPGWDERDRLEARVYF